MRTLTVTLTVDRPERFDVWPGDILRSLASLLEKHPERKTFTLKAADGSAIGHATVEDSGGR